MYGTTYLTYPLCTEVYWTGGTSYLLVSVLSVHSVRPGPCDLVAWITNTRTYRYDHANTRKATQRLGEQRQSSHTHQVCWVRLHSSTAWPVTVTATSTTAAAARLAV